MPCYGPWLTLSVGLASCDGAWVCAWVCCWCWVSEHGQRSDCGAWALGVGPCRSGRPQGRIHSTGCREGRGKVCLRCHPYTTAYRPGGLNEVACHDTTRTHHACPGVGNRRPLYPLQGVCGGGARPPQGVLAEQTCTVCCAMVCVARPVAVAWLRFHDRERRWLTGNLTSASPGRSCVCPLVPAQHTQYNTPVPARPSSLPFTRGLGSASAQLHVGGTVSVPGHRRVRVCVRARDTTLIYLDRRRFVAVLLSQG